MYITQNNEIQRICQPINISCILNHFLLPKYTQIVCVQSWHNKPPHLKNNIIELNKQWWAQIIFLLSQLQVIMSYLNDKSYYIIWNTICYLNDTSYAITRHTVMLLLIQTILYLHDKPCTHNMLHRERFCSHSYTIIIPASNLFTIIIWTDQYGCHGGKCTKGLESVVLINLLHLQITGLK